MKGSPRSKEFDDVYFSAEDGLAETCHVFLNGNGLPEAWAGADEFVIAETGFGTGLNFLAVWKLFLEHARPEQRLYFISVEKFPLKASEIDDALSHWEELSDLRAQLVAAYPKDPKGVFEFDFGPVKLSVYFDDVVDGFERCDAQVDVWFLDGFRPASNPEMWSDAVFEQIGRLSREGTRFATFTSAGFVRRGLQAAGFDVKKIPGFGRKREMSVGVYR
jgi:tRNA 5-methylaminomethyl-2-thiouridine biosynthesis bifunctional protein